jgi:hypothetical protein
MLGYFYPFVAAEFLSETNQLMPLLSLYNAFCRTRGDNIAFTYK